MFGKESQYFSIVGWNCLIDARHINLPRLLSLTLETPADTNANDHFFWIGLFASRSLVDVRMIPDDLNPGKLPWVTPNMASLILQLLLACCPSIQKLALYPDVRASYKRRSDSELCLINLMTRQIAYDQCIRYFVHLRELSATTALITSSSLRALGQLPHLKVLSIHACTDGVMFGGEDLGEGLFSSLEDLSLYLINPKEAVKILALKLLVRPLVRLSVKFLLENLQLESIHKDNWLCENLFPCLNDLTNPRSFSIDLDMTNHSNNDSEVFELLRTGELEEATSRLRLERLSIYSMAMDDAFYATNLNNIWPHITHLELPHQTTNAAVLVSLSKLPKLQYLLVALDLGEVDILLNQSKSIGCSLHTIECHAGSWIDSEPGNLNAHARYVVLI